MKQMMILALGVVGGIFFAMIDALPTWDDMGILALGILCFSGLLSLLGCRRPWLLALAVGLWIPIHDILSAQNFGSILALGFALLGAYLGWGLRQLLGKNSPPTQSTR